MEARADAPVALERVEVQILAARRDLTGVVEDRDVEAGAIRNEPELGGGQQAVAIAEAPGLVAAQRTAAAQLRQQEVRHQLVVSEDALDPSAQRDDPVLPQERQVLNDLAVHPLEVVDVVAIGIARERDAV